ncbi:Arabinogalactan peptide 20 [Striga hermonthica]|uniref:Arabinogalactan peptide 20 n=1 Tax=Striga hermonthica TaxID=68872 RepID=A0A9N7MS15_STRHE|nr:Arabinogalactan peptide 20 [Striga hermonthica]
MEIIGRALVAVVVMAVVAAVFPSVSAANVNSLVPAPAPAFSSDGTTIDQGIAYALMLLALVLTYIIH